MSASKVKISVGDNNDIWDLTKEIASTLRKEADARRELFPRVGEITIHLSKTLCPWAMVPHQDKMQVRSVVEGRIVETVENELTDSLHHEGITVVAIKEILREKVPKPFSISLQWRKSIPDGKRVSICP